MLNPNVRRLTVMSIQRRRSPISKKKFKESVSPDEFITSEVRVSYGVKLGAIIVWKTLSLFTIILVTIAIVLVLFVALFLFPESREQIFGILEMLIGGLSGSLGA